jgi:hypothetical protein
MPAEAQEHVRACTACAQELSELRSIETRLAGAAPSGLLPSGLERRVLARLRPRPRFAWAGIPAAAALLMASTLLTAWLLTSSAPRPLPEAAQASQAWTGPTALSEVEDSTANLLQAYEPVISQMTEVEPEEIQGYLSPTEQGGWNG